MSGFIRKTPWWCIWLAGFAFPIAYFGFRGVYGYLGPDPLEFWHHETGQLAIWFLIAAMVVTPIRKYSFVSFLPWRRHLGLISAAYAFTHVGLWALDQGVFSRMIEEVIKRSHIIVGMAALFIYIVLTVTSNRYAIRRLGSHWRSIHWYTHPMALLVVLHHVMSLKTYWEPTWAIQLACIVMIWGTKFLPARRRV